MSIEDRVRAATRARADLVRDIRPFALPENVLSSEDRPERARRRGARLVPAWLGPLAAAAVVVVVALTLVAVRQEAAPRQGRPAAVPSAAFPAAPASVLAKLPRYYAAITADGATRHFTVVDVKTGKQVVDFAAPGNSTLGSVSASADDKTFILTYSMPVNQHTTRWTVLKIRLFPHPGLAWNEANIAVQDTDNAVYLNAFLSPGGEEVAVEFVRDASAGSMVTTTVQVYHATQSSTGALRTWTTTSRAGPIRDLAWHGNDQTLVFSTADPWVPGPRPPAYNRERALTTTAPSGDLIAASRVFFSGPPSSDPTVCNALRITPDGQTALCGTRAGTGVPDRSGCWPAGPGLVAYSVRSGQRERVLVEYPRCDAGAGIPVWTDATGGTVVGLFRVTSGQSGRWVLGVAAGGKFYSLPLPAALVDGSGEGSAVAF